MNSSVKKKVIIIAIVITAMLVLSSSSVLIALAANDWSFSNNNELATIETDAGVDVMDYTSTRNDITGEKLTLEDPEIAEKSWVECVDYTPTPYYTTEADENGMYYEIYIPEDLSSSLIMAIRDYQIEGVDQNASVGITWQDLAPMFEMIVMGNIGVIASGGVISGAYGAIVESLIAADIWNTIEKSSDIITACRYYQSPAFMGIPGDEGWEKGITNESFYTASSLTISMAKSSSYSIAKTNTMSSKMSIGGEFKSSVKVSALFAASEIDLNSKVSSEFSYGVNFQQSQQVQQSQTVSRTFSARTEEVVNGVGWKLCEYIAKIPIHVYGYNADGDCLGETYLEYNYLQGVCRVFANGYIEHWNSGELVSYPEFFEGFCTATQVMEQAKAKQDAQN